MKNMSGPIRHMILVNTPEHRSKQSKKSWRDDLVTKTLVMADSLLGTKR